MDGRDLLAQVQAAIGAHGAWKLKLSTAVSTGRSDDEPASVCRDDLCRFGAWLHGPDIAPSIRQGKPYQVVRRLHAEFHQCAGEVLDRVKRGDQAGASALLAGDYTDRSATLIRALTKWKSELQAVSEPV
ncbi:CZB domain-containing protein [Sphingomonas sp. R647]|uniref:CZB domain-containing protein n=1 Tax=Sphingomonas sp. R647 TaxID=2875233 RepID=UPI001CD3893F|nr:CZB domain-containing protein [Sphingomonas sp. R647]MCA1197674.1 CZB domain-containing protein [Sphingomonas sp. R647]